MQTLSDVGAGAAVTASNVIDKIGLVVDAIPSTLYTSEDMFIYVSQNVARAYTRALGGFQATDWRQQVQTTKVHNGTMAEDYLLTV